MPNASTGERQSNLSNISALLMIKNLDRRPIPDPLVINDQFSIPFLSDLGIDTATNHKKNHKFITSAPAWRLLLFFWLCGDCGGAVSIAAAYLFIKQSYFRSEEDLMPTPAHREPVSPAPWGLVLAAGDGKRIQDYVREVIGKDLPKQYVNFIGKRSMLERTFRRAEKWIPADRILTIVSRHHLTHEEVQRQLSSRPAQTIIVQPDNKDTGPGILLPLMHLYKRAPEAVVAVFPSDHFIVEEDRFMEHVALAARAVAHDPTRIVLLAMEAQYPEVEYGYIVPREDHGRSSNVWGLRAAARFVEKPDLATAQRLVESGGLWNTMIMVFKARTMLNLLQRHCSTTFRRFGRIFNTIGTPDETNTTEEVYRTLNPLNFSKEFLEMIAVTSPRTIAVLPVSQVFWSDWGSARRLLQGRELLANSKKTRPAQPRTFAGGETSLAER